MITFLDLCSGIGGGRLGLEKNGFKCVGFSEILSTSVKVYKSFFDVSYEDELGDLTKLDLTTLPCCDLLIAGFPCQAFSIQGLRKGFADERGQIIFYIQKILKEKKIKYFILENVKGLVNHDKGQTLNFIIQLLQDAGYNVFYKILKSCDFGLPQKRERIYFVGIRKDLNFCNYLFPAPLKQKAFLKDFLIDNDPKYLYSNFSWLEKYMNNKYNKGKYNLNKILEENYLVVDTRQSDMRFFRDYIPTLRTGRSGILYVRNGILRKLSGRESLLLQGFGFDIFNKAQGYSDSLLLQQTGNAMSVNVIEAIAAQLKNIMIKNGDF